MERMLANNFEEYGDPGDSAEGDEMGLEEESEPPDEKLLLFKCIVGGDWERLAEIFKASEDASSLAESTNDHGIPIQCYACILGRTRCLTILLDQGADKDVRYSPHGLMLQHLAASWGHVECLTYLLEKGFDEFAISDIGTIPFAEAVQNRQPIAEWFLLKNTKASMKELITTAKKLIEDFNIANKSGITAEEASAAGTAYNKVAEWMKSPKNKNCTWTELSEQHIGLLGAVAPAVRKLVASEYEVANFFEPSEIGCVSLLAKYLMVSRALNLISEEKLKEIEAVVRK